MASELVDLFEPCLVNALATTPDQETVEDLLLQAMEDEFECEVDDGSSPAVAKDIVDLWKAVVAGESLVKVEALEALAVKSKATKVEVQRAADDDDEDDEESEDDVMDEDSEVDQAPALLSPQHPSKPTNEPEVDEDGFTVVKSKSRR